MTKNRKRCFVFVVIVARLSLCSCGPCAFHSLLEHRIHRSRGSIVRRFLSDDYHEDCDAPQNRKRMRPTLRHSVTEHNLQLRRIHVQKQREVSLQDPTLLTSIRFAECNNIHPASRRAIVETMGFQEMTQIQAEAYAPAVQGMNIIGRARTGTGKTLAFLVPSIERLVQGGISSDLYTRGRTIGILILAPTRELAQQIADQASLLLTYHSSDLSVACLYGGTKTQGDLNRYFSNPTRLPAILVATPGRLLEHLTQTKIQGRKLSDIMGATKIVILDEMDCLLDLGFKKDVLKIMSYLSRHRQTLLFSATRPRSLCRELILDLLGDDFQEINCVDETDTVAMTNSRVEQYYIQMERMEDYVALLIRILQEEMDRNSNFKIVVFLPTVKLVGFVADYLESILGIAGVGRLHSRMSQSARQRTNHQFRATSALSILVTTDISSRGVDYPGVSLVLQYGSPQNKETYMHRLGRTGRAGSNGRCIQVVLPFERRFLAQVKKRGIMEYSKLSQSFSDRHPGWVDSTASSTSSSLLVQAAEGAYRSFLAYYIERASPELGFDVPDVLKAAEAFAHSAGLSQLPGLEKQTAIRLGIDHFVTTFSNDE